MAGDLRRLNTTVVNEPFAPQCVVSRAHWNPACRVFNQQDVNEAYLVLLVQCNRVDEEILQSLDGVVFHIDRNSTPVCHIFGGLLSSQLKCLACSRSTQSLEAIYTLPLQMPEEVHPIHRECSDVSWPCEALRR